MFIVYTLKIQRRVEYLLGNLSLYTPYRRVFLHLLLISFENMLRIELCLALLNFRFFSVHSFNQSCHQFPISLEFLFIKPLFLSHLHIVCFQFSRQRYTEVLKLLHVVGLWNLFKNVFGLELSSLFTYLCHQNLIMFSEFTVFYCQQLDGFQIGLAVLAVRLHLNLILLVLTLTPLLFSLYYTTIFKFKSQSQSHSIKNLYLCISRINWACRDYIPNFELQLHQFLLQNMESSSRNNLKFEEQKVVHQDESGRVNRTSNRKGEQNSLQRFISSRRTIDVLLNKGIKYLFPIQFETYDIIYDKYDLIARDRTGSGKTLAFSLPIIERFRDRGLFSTHSTKFLIVLPTRELANQVKNQISSLRYSHDEFDVVPVYGGVNLMDQVREVRRGADIIVSTPGRLLDLLERGQIKLDQLKVVCLDQADEMLRQGFQEDIEKIFKYIKKHTDKKTQNLLFSATIPTWVLELSRTYLSPERKFIDLIKDEQIKTSKTIEHLGIYCQNARQRDMSINNVLSHYAGKDGRIIVFTQTKREANSIGDRAIIKSAEVLHGDIPQRKREYIFRNFKQGKIRGIIATNVAARGLDIPEVDLIIQLQPPKDVQTYIHRAGRTGRAGRKGVCVTFYTQAQKRIIYKIQEVAQIKIKDIRVPDAREDLEGKKSKRRERSRSKSSSRDRRRSNQRKKRSNSSNSRSSSSPSREQRRNRSKSRDRRRSRSNSKDRSTKRRQRSRSDQKRDKRRGRSRSRSPRRNRSRSNRRQRSSSDERKRSQAHNDGRSRRYETRQGQRKEDPTQKNDRQSMIAEQNKKSLSQEATVIKGSQVSSQKVESPTDRISEHCFPCTLKMPVQSSSLSCIFNFLQKNLSNKTLQQVRNMKKLTATLCAFELPIQCYQQFCRISTEVNSRNNQYQLQISDSEVAKFLAQTQPLPTPHGDLYPVTEAEIRNAQKNRKILEVLVSGLPKQIVEIGINNLLLMWNIRHAGFRMVKSQVGEEFKGQIYVLCADDQNKRKLLSMNGETFDGKMIIVEDCNVSKPLTS